MINSFDELSRTLDLKSPATNDDLNKLIDWCETTVSNDLHIDGDLNERFDFYRQVSTVFLEKIKPNINTEQLAAPIPALKNWSSLQAIVTMGLDSYLKTLKPTAEQLNTKINSNPLIVLAASEGNAYTTEVLLSLGVNPCEKIMKGPPLLFATLMLPIQHDKQLIDNKTAIYRVLCPYFNVLDERNESGDTLLHAMSLSGYEQLVEELISHAATKELVFVPNNSARYPIHTAILNGQFQCAKLLLNVDGVAKLTDAKGQNPLHYAAIYGSSHMVNICLTNGSLEATDKRKRTSLILAAKANNTDAMNELLQRGADVNALDSQGRSALHYAVEANNLIGVKALLKNPKIDVNLSDSNHKNPLDIVNNDSISADISQLLTEHGAKHYQDNGSSLSP